MCLKKSANMEMAPKQTRVCSLWTISKRPRASYEKKTLRKKCQIQMFIVDCIHNRVLMLPLKWHQSTHRCFIRISTSIHNKASIVLTQHNHGLKDDPMLKKIKNKNKNITENRVHLPTKSTTPVANSFIFKKGENKNFYA